MNLKKVWQDFAQLPEEAQQEVANLIVLLQMRYREVTDETRAKRIDLADEEFIGIWEDRQDMEDSSEWVRDVRKSEWQ